MSNFEITYSAPFSNDVSGREVGVGQRKGGCVNMVLTREENVQGSDKRRGLGCVDSFPGSAWL